MHISEIVNEVDLVSVLPEATLDEIGEKVHEWYEEDSRSREDWEKKYTRWVELASQVMKQKNIPWRNAANIKYPLLTQAALQFNARILPALTPNAEPVGAKVIGDDPDGARYQEAIKVSRHMNYQLADEITEWEEDFDRLTMVLAITGQEYKKTYFSYEKNRICSEYVSSADLVLHYWYGDFENTRKTHKMPMTYNNILERMNMGLYKYYTEEELGAPSNDKMTNDQLRFNSDLRQGINSSRVDEDTPHLLLEHHGWYDLDEDGYAEPYRIVIHKNSKKVLQISPRFTEDDVELTENGEVIKITPIEYYTKFGMIPNPDGSNYDIGFGVLITPLNETVNTTINQLLDAGTLAVMQSGFIGKGVRLKGGAFQVQPGKWPIVNTTGGNLKDNIVPLPVKDPSDTLFKLMIYMVDAAKDLYTGSGLFTGELPGQNTKAGVAQTVHQEGLKVFNSVYKRVRRSLKREMIKIFKLNYILLKIGDESSKTVRSAQLFGVTTDHYNPMMMAIEPSADPAIAIKEQRVQKDMGVLQLIGTYGGNVQEALLRVLQSLEVQGLEKLMQVPESKPDPQLILDKAEIERKIQKDKDEIEIKKMEQILRLLELQMNASKEGDQAALEIAKIIKDYTKIEADLEKNDRKIASANKGTVE